MGVHSLWGILEPTSRAVRLESLSRKRMAVDASIWIYQFLKAVRDKSGNPLSSSHIVGFFRRICKLLYFGILPVFVFDGGAPVLKRETINKRKERRQGKRDDASKTAQKLLALQIQKKHDSPSKSLPSKASTFKDNNIQGLKEEEDDIEYKYLDDHTTPADEERKPIFKGMDEYDLPHIKGFEYEKNDNRISAEEFKDMSEQMDELEGIDLNTIDPGSREFEELPLTTQYMILSQLRLRSRLRMGYTKEQLENIFPDSLDFSKFQIQMVQKRNFFTQRLMNITGMDESDSRVQRVAGEKDKEYKIEKTEGGWALSLDEGASYSNPVDLDKEERKKQKEEKGEDPEDSEDDIDWEDVKIEANEKKQVSHAMNALPLPPAETVVGAGDSTLRSFMAYSPHKKNSKSNNTDDGYNSEDEALKQIEEIELMEAIQKSKKELALQKELELEVSTNKYGDGVSDESKKPLNTTDDEKKEEIEDENEEFEGLPFDFEDGAKEIDTSPKKDAPSIQSLTNMDSLLGFSAEKSNREASGAKPSNDTKVSAPVSTPTATPSTPQKRKRSVPSVPSWFNNTFENPYTEITIPKPREKEPESMNLVSWSEAKDYIESKSDSPSKTKDYEPDDDDVVELVRPELTAKSTEESKPQTPEFQSSVKESVANEESENLEHSDPAPPVVDYDFSESEEEQLVEQLEKEEKEHEEFQKDLNPHILNTFVEDEKYLKDQQKRELRDSDEVTVTMIKEVQELLARFGIPYITAPMEAEAQCATLLELKLVDGIITDDSDVFLFGGDRVYKNMFHEKHYVEFYSGQDIERELGLSRQKLIEMAHLLGSDYTEGLKGIGPANAVKILSHFGDLSNFRDWFIEGQFDVSKQQNEESFLKTLRKKMIKNDIFLDNKFPDRRIDQAYLQADVDKDKTEFIWGTPDLDRIRTFLMSSVGWSQERVDQVLVPLIKDLNKKKREGNQSTIGEFYPVDAFNQKRNRTLKVTNKRGKDKSTGISDNGKNNKKGKRRKMTK